MKKLAIIGAGDLGQQMAYHLESDNQFKCVGFLDDFAPANLLVNEIPVLGKLKDANSLFSAQKFDGLIIGIGYNHIAFRAMVFEKLSKSIPFFSFVHSTSFIAKNVVIGNGTFIFPRCIIDIKSRIGNNCVFYNGCNISHDNIIENHVFISPGVQIGGFCNIGRNSHLGIGTIIKDNINLCSSTKTGAGAVLVKNTEEPGLYIGCPAKIKSQ
jgi:sugar O-acyltransferase (sialic acid O-acetyltransferase NeuD family)